MLFRKYGARGPSHLNLYATYLVYIIHDDILAYAYNILRDK